MLRGLFILDTDAYNRIYGEEERKEIGELVDIYAPQQTPQSISDNPALLQKADIILSGWGAPLMDSCFLQAAPRLQAVFYGAGSIKGFATDAFWDRGIRVTSAYAANARPVAEYALSQILFCLKRGWHFALSMKREGRYIREERVAGAFGSIVGIISLGVIGRMVCEYLRFFDVKVVAYDPYVNEETAALLNVELCSMEEVFRRADVISLHTPWLKETENMIGGAHFTSMKPYASFINTSRGAIVREREMIDALVQRPDLQAVLDVTYPEPPEEGSPLYTLPNVVVTPHIAGSMDRECRRMGRYMVGELKRYMDGQPMQWEITRQMAAIMA